MWITVLLDYSITGLPEFVADISACTDIQKQYVLPNGYVYEYTSIFVPTAANQLQLATDQDGVIYNGIGYRDGARIRAVLEISECDYAFVTGFIPVKKGDIIYFGGNCFWPESEYAGAMNIVFYNAGKRTVSQVSMSNSADGFFNILETNEQGYVTAMEVNGTDVPDTLAYIRFTLLGVGEKQIISVNETLDIGYEEFAWMPGALYVPSSWHEEIANTVETVNSMDVLDSSTAIRFLLASDIHLDPDSTTSYTSNMGKVCAEVMRACQIPFFATAGDNCTQSSGFKPSDFARNMQQVLEQLLPIPRNNILLAVGNHDGATGQREYNGETVYYRYQLSNEERSAVFFNWQRETNQYKRFDEDGTYFYLDDAATKTRYIILNSFWSQWEGEEDGFVPDIQHGFMQTPIFGPKQMEWFASEALDMPPGYGAVIITHNAPVSKDFEIFKGIVDAYSGKTYYEGTYVGAEEWQTTDITVNYKYADGEIIAVFQGHNHKDGQFDYYQQVPCIEITTAGAYWAVKDEDVEKRVKGTSTEFAVDVVVIDRASRTIYLTRLGAGSDKVITY